MTDHSELAENSKFAFLGTPRFAVYVLEELEKAGLLPVVVFCAPDMPVGRKRVLTSPPVKVWAQERGITVEQPVNKKELEKAISTYQLDVSIVAAYNIIISPIALKHPKHGTINIHPSLLPRHRGPAPIQQTILDGDTTTGVCIMQLDEQVDHGPLLGCKERSLTGTETYLELEEELSRHGGQLLVSLLPDYLSGSQDLKDQDHAKATLTHRFTLADGQFDLAHDDPIAIDRKVRALNPEPIAWTVVETKKGPKRLKVLSGSIIDGTYTPKRVIPEGKKEMDWDDFLRGNV